MNRKITRNGAQFKLTIPIELVKKLKIDENSSILIKEIKTPLGIGFAVIKDEGVWEVT